MADDHRYDWLDNDAVEKLLRGEPVDTCRNKDNANGSAQADADRLAAALNALAEPVGPAAGPLPGEDEAVAAFRAARTAGAARTVSREHSGGQEFTVVRTVGARFGRTLAGRPSRLRRPLRAGMVAVLAGCAFGGVAVAAGAGVLPFAPSTAEPRPATSVSAAERGGEESVRPELSTGPVSPPGGTPDDTGRPAPSEETDGGPSGEPTPPASAGGGTGREDDPATPDSTPPATQDPDRKRWVVTACRQYLTGQTPDIAPEKLRRLEKAAGGPAAVRRYCEQIIRGGGQDDGGDSGGKGSGGSGGGDGDGDDDHGGGDHGGGEDGDSGGGTGSPPPPPPDPTPSPSVPATPGPDPEPSPSTDPGGSGTGGESVTPPPGTDPGEPAGTPGAADGTGAGDGVPARGAGS